MDRSQEPRGEELSALLPELQERLEAHARRLIQTLGSTGDSAADLVQTVYLKLHERPGLLPRQDGEQGIVRYAMCMITSAVIDGRRRKGLHQVEAWDHEELEELAETISSTGAVTREDQARFIHGLIEQLPAEHKAVLQLLIYGGLRFEQIGNLLGISPRAARRRFEQVRSSLERRLRRE